MRQLKLILALTMLVVFSQGAFAQCGYTFWLDSGDVFEDGGHEFVLHEAGKDEDYCKISVDGTQYVINKGEKDFHEDISIEVIDNIWRSSPNDQANVFNECKMNIYEYDAQETFEPSLQESFIFNEKNITLIEVGDESCSLKVDSKSLNIPADSPISYEDLLFYVSPHTSDCEIEVLSFSDSADIHLTTEEPGTEFTGRNVSLEATTEEENACGIEVDGSLIWIDLETFETIKGLAIAPYYAHGYVEYVSLAHDRDSCGFDIKGCSCDDDFECQDSCTDTDGGEKYYEKGSITGSMPEGFISEDKCIVPEGRLREVVCIDNYGSAKLYDCPHGCENGKCIQENTECMDTDEGLDYNVKGTVTDSSGKYTDKCIDTREGPMLVEYTCKDNAVKGEQHLCSGTCQDGECVQENTKCMDTDEGLNYNVKGEISGDMPEGFISEDKCIVPEGRLREVVCIDNYGSAKLYDCPHGCENGKCISKKITQCLDDDNYCPNKCNYENDNDCPECKSSKDCNDDNPCTADSCQEDECVHEQDSGCNLNGVCVPIGTRDNGLYCSVKNKMTEQNTDGGSCDNNYECESNVCVNSECIKPSFIQNIFDWFAKLFG